jgi:hypothetical protein
VVHSRAVEEVGGSLADGAVASASAEMEEEEAVGGSGAGSDDRATDGGSRTMRSFDEAAAAALLALVALGAEALARFFFAMSERSDENGLMILTMPAGRPSVDGFYGSR